jgi:alcohol dehydrogenase
MKALMFVAPGQLRFDEVDAPTVLEPGDALVRPLAATTCDLDHHVIDGRTPFSGAGPFPLAAVRVASPVAET